MRNSRHGGTATLRASARVVLAARNEADRIDEDVGQAIAVFTAR